MITEREKFTPLLASLRSMDEIREVRIVHKLMIYGADASLKDVHGQGWMEWLK